uniref:ATP-dependent Clp protease proteolytic subunit like, bacteria origin n=1 Tax=Drosera capensis TaxID=4366 RepID=UPI0024116DB2|nr:ATP-dependent Clp protease proteolytic subunit like, bacteria origin [Drosera capensis]WEQ03450.1 ATP-dependent Clp protease proteolytic subunit like, bacteria origin [Drosera capensis]
MWIKFCRSYFIPFIFFFIFFFLLIIIFMAYYDYFGNPQVPYKVPYISAPFQGMEENKVRWASALQRLKKIRIIFLTGQITELFSTRMKIYLIHYENAMKDMDLTLYVNSNGGLLRHTLSISDVIDRVNKKKIITICWGVAISGAALILASGFKSERSALLNARIMGYQPYFREYLTEDEHLTTGDPIKKPIKPKKPKKLQKLQKLQKPIKPIKPIKPKKPNDDPSKYPSEDPTKDPNENDVVLDLEELTDQSKRFKEAFKDKTNRFFLRRLDDKYFYLSPMQAKDYEIIDKIENKKGVIRMIKKIRKDWERLSLVQSIVEKRRNKMYLDKKMTENGHLRKVYLK